MAIRKFLLPEGTMSFAFKCMEWLRTAEQQKVIATEMIERSQKMRDRAEEMRKTPVPHRRPLGF